MSCAVRWCVVMSYVVMNGVVGWCGVSCGVELGGSSVWW